MFCNTLTYNSEEKYCNTFCSTSCNTFLVNENNIHLLKTTKRVKNLKLKIQDKITLQKRGLNK